jgi:hypothetical protein
MPTSAVLVVENFHHRPYAEINSGSPRPPDQPHTEDRLAHVLSGFLPFARLAGQPVLAEIFASCSAPFGRAHQAHGNLPGALHQLRLLEITLDAISTERAAVLLNEIAALGITGLRFTGGEPLLLRRDFFEVTRCGHAARFKTVIVQTNGLPLKKLHKEINDSAITKIAVSIDGLNETNDQIRGIRGYFDLAMQGIKLLRNKEVVLSVTLNKLSVSELKGLAAVASAVSAELEFNILSRSLYFLAGADLDALWPSKSDVVEIANFLRGSLHRPEYEIGYITRYYNREKLASLPACWAICRFLCYPKETCAPAATRSSRLAIC